MQFLRWLALIPILLGKEGLEVGQGLWKGKVDGGVAGNEGEGTFVEVEAQIVAAGGRAEHYEAYVGSHWHKAEVEPSGGYFIKIGRDEVCRSYFQNGEEGHEGLGMAEAELYRGACAVIDVAVGGCYYVGQQRRCGQCGSVAKY